MIKPSNKNHEAIYEAYKKERELSVNMDNKSLQLSIYFCIVVWLQKFNL
jgi:hypothetical protein